MNVKSLSIKNFRGIQEMDIDFQPGINVLIGNNGAGKSAILDLLAILLSRLIGRIRSSTGTGRFYTEFDIHNNALDTVNSVKVNCFGKDVQWTVAKTRSPKKKQTITKLEEIKTIIEYVHNLFENDENVNLPVAVLYSVHRAVLDIPLRIKKRHKFSQLAAYDQALSKEGRNDFRLFFEWFRMREDLENENARHQYSLFQPDGWEFPDRQLEAVRRATEMLLPGYRNMRVRRSPLRMTLEKKGKELRIDQLSDGEKCTIALIGDMARRMAIANPSLPNPLEGEGVILVDEIDLHLHPSWERIIAPKLIEIFPNCQFIISTHSPIVVSEVKADCVYVLSETENGIQYSQPDVSYGKTANRILEDVMDVPARPPEIEKNLSDLFEYIERNEIEKAKNLAEQLKESLKPDDPELIKADIRIRHKEFINE